MKGAVVDGGLVGFLFTYNENNKKFNVEATSNNLLLSEGYLECYRPDAKSGLIRPLTIQDSKQKRYQKSTSSKLQFRLLRTINHQ